ncbi:VPLPA-CTERM sorting domain-containing protein [Rhodobacteraceae bacterium N5(2021)]|uniref:VPLPA-CTERM sorting domain-containing protein n=1 Tax=Gymnodinialimonas phycosphaerae TaxID=2841589 RepID=A0A975TXB4_9RHOB|nr:VPLPA-CTERM sorting domain-containing protein [Gymnodinialimonas phycosphaerae]MBY4892410.1 VPLPA-CTERM sorting domain-containing protein [Gymnodinialimonas phycosphaerae]
MASATVLDMLGTAEFTDGQTSILSEFTNNANGDADPFNRFFGTDLNSQPTSFGDISFTHSFAAGDYTNAFLELSIFDHDSFDPGQDTIDIFFDGIAQDTSIWEGISTRQASIHIRSMAVDAALLTDGFLEVRIFANVSGFGTSTLPGNGIGVDYSSLSADPATAPIPLPAGGWLLLAGLGVMAARRRKG